MSNDITIKCTDCGRTFEFTAQEQEFYRKQRFTNPDGSIRPPKRCRTCRLRRKNAEEKQQEQSR